MGQAILKIILLLATTFFTAFALGPPKSIKTIFQFPDSLPFSWPESFVIRPDGTFLVNRLDVPEVWCVNLFDVEAFLVYTFPKGTILLGIAVYKPSVYGGAVGNFSFDPTTAGPRVKEITAIPEAVFLNGLIGVGTNAHGPRDGQSKPTLLVVDTALGVVYAVDTSRGHYNNFTEPLLVPPTPPTPGGPGGINGIKSKNHYLYFSNSDRGPSARLPIQVAGGIKLSPSGPVETIATMSHFNDDFNVLDEVTAFGTTDPDNSVTKYTPGLGLTTIAGGLNQTIVAGATACLFRRAEKGKNVLYGTTSGGHGGPVNGTFTESSKIVAIKFQA